MKLTSTITPLLCSLMLALTLNAQSVGTLSEPNTSHLNDDTAAGISPALTLNEATRGVVFKTAAINSNGTIANCFRCNGASTLHLGTGIYQVGFDENVQAVRGWSRMVQVDTLGTGSLNAWCTTADRAGVANAIWVSCQAPGGPGSMGKSVPADVSFFIFVAR